MKCNICGRIDEDVKEMTIKIEDEVIKTGCCLICFDQLFKNTKGVKNEKIHNTKVEV